MTGASFPGPACREARVVAHEAHDWPPARHHFLRLSCPGWQAWAPGQFVMIRPQEGWAPLVWGRPFSLCEVTGDELTLFYQETGRGTRRLGDLRPGDAVLVWGPLGNGFAPPATPTLLLAGGFGIAPFVGYAARHAGRAGMSFLFGHRPPIAAFPFAAIAERMPATAMRETCAADLGAFIRALEERIEDAKDGLVLACGPMPFLRTVKRLCQKAGAQAQLSLESRMACGVGACLGCVVKTEKPRKPVPAPGWPVQVCLAGPVFWADEVDLEQEAGEKHG